MRNTNVRKIWEHPGIANGFTHGISLHSHTSHSRESLEFIPQYARRSKILGKIMDLAEWQYYSRTGNQLDCSQAFWTPPLSPLLAQQLEAGQIARHFHLPAMVSLTDHDDCRAGLETNGPISMEWTIPFAPSFFHLGIHNLPPAYAESLVADMKAYTAAPDPTRLSDLLDTLDRHADVLIVLNHPLWDEGLVGKAQHACLAESFLRRFGPWIHALELNGLRCSEENDRVLAMAEEFDLTAISGGDRHGREPNANVNLTRACTFSEFVHEVRYEQISEVAVMPQYREPLRLRQFETAWDILRYDRDRMDGCRSWCDRVFFTCERGYTRPLSYFFGEQGPKILVPLLAAMNLLEMPAVRPMFSAFLRAAFTETTAAI
jgi:hypothetical protein